MCVVEINLHNQVLRYTFKGWREALEFTSEYTKDYIHVRIYSLGS